MATLKLQFQGLRPRVALALAVAQDRKSGVRQPTDEHFSDKRNEEIGVLTKSL